MHPTFFRSVWAIFRKDIAVWLRNGRNIAATIVPPLAFLLVQAVGAVAVGRSPVALVTLDNGAKGQQMKQIFHQADVFRITDTSPAQAQKSAELRVLAADIVDLITSKRSTDAESDWANLEEYLRQCYASIQSELSNRPIKP